MSRFVLSDRWRTHFSPVQTNPIIAERTVDKNGRERLLPRFELCAEPIAQQPPSDADAGSDAAAAPAAPKRTAAAAARSRFRAYWRRMPFVSAPIRTVHDEDGDPRTVDLEDLLYLQLADDDVPCEEALAVGLDDQCPLLPDEKYDDVGQLKIERMTGKHLPGSLLLEWELFGEDTSLITDFAMGTGHGYCAIDESRRQIVGHTLFEYEDDTLMYTSFATTAYWRGRGVAKAMVSGMMQWVFAQPQLQVGHMQVRGGHTEVIGLYKWYGFDEIENDDGVEETYEDGERKVTMGGPLKFHVFAKRLGWTWKSREEFVGQL
eukprot:TRINITY_DN4060_c0_g1_i1.p1 TRINITY_DN4060_c0_g1~~TRINITY_DN4060_c0_g1_i1.p1  ORF type:complete len:333 (+),score=61.05 TRINITY_DN4060_c0_g1_i1:45-1001(+)